MAVKKHTAGNVPDSTIWKIHIGYIFKTNGRVRGEKYANGVLICCFSYLKMKREITKMKHRFKKSLYNGN